MANTMKATTKDGKITAFKDRRLNVNKDGEESALNEDVSAFSKSFLASLKKRNSCCGSREAKWEH